MFEWDEAKKINIGLVGAMVVILMIGISIFFDIYYDLNDDVLIKDILAGVHTGTPNGHAVQMLYPLGFLISIFYRIVPVLPWYGYFLCGCYLLCFILIGIRLVEYTETIGKKIGILALEMVLIIGLFGYEMVYVQYTVISALLAGTAAFWFYTTPLEEEDPTYSLQRRRGQATSFLKKVSVSMVLVVLAYMIRSEMLLLMTPFIGLTGLLKWSKERFILHKETIRKYLIVIGTIVLCVWAAYLGDRIAYGSQEWKGFWDFFHARTEVYDFTWYAPYEGNEEFYESIGMDETGYTLLDNYNFGLDHSIDEHTLQEIADYAIQIKGEQGFFTKLREILSAYKYRLFSGADYPYNMVVLIGYLGLGAVAWLIQDKSYIWKVAVMLFCRNIPWFYILYKGRIVDRIIHPLYLVELLILIALILEEAKDVESLHYTKGLLIGRSVDRRPQVAGVAAAIALAVIGVVTLPNALTNMLQEKETRMAYNASDLSLKEYCRGHSENYYYVDVYSTITFSETMFKNVDNDRRNYDLLGGWANRSPMSDQIWEEVGFNHFIIQEGESVQWLQDYYDGLEEDVVIEMVDTIEVPGARDVEQELEEEQLDIRNFAVYEIARK